MLEYRALVQPQIKLIEAAAAAGVKWILPTEYGTDSANEEITEAVPFNSIKIAPRLRLEELTQVHEGLKWIGVITNLWFDYVCQLSSRANSESQQVDKHTTEPYSRLLQNQRASAHSDASRRRRRKIQHHDQKHRRPSRDAFAQPP